MTEKKSEKDRIKIICAGDVYIPFTNKPLTFQECKEILFSFLSSRFEINGLVREEKESSSMRTGIRKLSS